MTPARRARRRRPSASAPIRRDVLVSEDGRGSRRPAGRRRGAHRRPAPPGADPDAPAGPARRADARQRGHPPAQVARERRRRRHPRRRRARPPRLCSDLPAHPIAPEVLLPAPGQGTLALEVRAGRPAAELSAPPSIDAATARAAEAERRVVAAFGGDCTLPLAAWARPRGGRTAVRLTALLATPDGRHVARGEAVAATAGGGRGRLRRRDAGGTGRTGCWRGFGRRSDPPSPASASSSPAPSTSPKARRRLRARPGPGSELFPLLEVVPPADPRPLERAAAEAGPLRLDRLHLGERRRGVPAAHGPPARRPEDRRGGPRDGRGAARRGIEPHLDRRAKADAEGLAAELAPVTPGRRVLLPQAADARPTLSEGLTAAGAEAVTRRGL